MSDDKAPRQPLPSATIPETKTPRVRVMQDEDSAPVRVKVVEEPKEASLGLFALVIFAATLLGTLIGLGADFGELLGSVEQIGRIVNPPTQLCVAGSNTILGEGLNMAYDWETAFEAQHRVNVQIRGIGSTAGVEEAIEGTCVHILAMSEPMTDSQYQRLIDASIEIDCAAEIGFDVLTFITNLNNPIVRDIRDPDIPGDNRPISRSILVRDLRSILNGGIRDWAELGNWPTESGSLPITILLRKGSGTSEIVMNRLIRFEQQPIPNEIRDDVGQVTAWATGNLYPAGVNYLLCDSNPDCLNRVLEIPGSLYWAAEAWLRTQPPDYLSALTLLEGDERGVNPLQDNVELELYPKDLIRPLYLYVLDSEGIDDKSNTLAREFLTFVRSIPGQSILDSYSFYNHFSRPIDVDVPFPEPFFNIPLPGQGQRTICTSV